jgi:uncharacterized membrane protein
MKKMFAVMIVIAMAVAACGKKTAPAAPKGGDMGSGSATAPAGGDTGSAAPAGGETPAPSGS